MPLSPVVFALCMLNVVFLIWLGETGVSYWGLVPVAILGGGVIGLFECWIVARTDRKQS